MSAFVDQERGRFGVEPICRELEVSARAYRQRRGGKLSRRGQRDRVLLEEIRRAHAESDESKKRVWRTRLDLELALLTYIGWYNQRRLHRSLGGRTPDEVAAAYRQPPTESDERITTKTN